MTTTAARDLVKEGMAAAKAGDKPGARALLRQATVETPHNEAAWLWLAGVTDEPNEAITHLERALRINPANERAQAGLSYFRSLVQSSGSYSCRICLAKHESKLDRCPSCHAYLDLEQGDVLLGNIHPDKEGIRQGAVRLAASVRKEPTFEHHFSLGLAFMNLCQPEEAVEQLRAAWILNADYPGLATNIAAIEFGLSESLLPTRRHSLGSATQKMPAISASRCVLIVDDSPTIRKLVGLTLQKNGYRVVEAGDGNEALERIAAEGNPDMILLDINMPGMDGYTLCKLLRQNPATTKIPIVMLSGRDGFFNKMRGKLAGSDQYLTKPFQPDILVKVVREYCPAAGLPVPAAIS